MKRVFVIGVGMTKFEKPGVRDWDYPDIGREAAQRALEDAAAGYDAIDQTVAGYCYGDSTCGQRAAYELGLTGTPIVNVNNNCATGSSALFLARQAIRAGTAECVLALGFEKMSSGSLDAIFNDRTPPTGRHFKTMKARHGIARAPLNAQIFAWAGREYLERYRNAPPDLFAAIATQNHRHSVHNPFAQFQTEYSLDEVLAAKTVFEPLTKLQCCPTSDGGAAAVLASEAFVQRHGLANRAVEVVGQAMATDRSSTFGPSDMSLVGYDMTSSAALAAYEEAGIGPDEVDVVELHDCFSTNAIIAYEALGLCPPGGAASVVMDGGTTYGGAHVVNPSGGLISKGHPLGATGLAQCAELVTQLRSEAGPRQVSGAKTALQHNVGLGGAAVVTVYRAPPARMTAQTADVRVG
jgi:acetyl-CoA acetyltransferase